MLAREYKSADDLRRVICEAFATVPCPKGRGVIAGTGTEEKDLARAYADRRWDELSPEFLRVNNALGFFTPAANQYYLPAFLLASLDFYSADMLSKKVVYSLCRLLQAKRGGGSRLARETLERLTSAQRAAIAAFLDHISQEYSNEFNKKDLDR